METQTPEQEKKKLTQEQWLAEQAQLRADIKMMKHIKHQIYLKGNFSVMF